MIPDKVFDKLYDSLNSYQLSRDQTDMAMSVVTKCFEVCMREGLISSIPTFKILEIAKGTVHLELPMEWHIAMEKWTAKDALNG